VRTGAVEFVAAPTATPNISLSFDKYVDRWAADSAG
jgi:hypothetical protein